MKPGPAYALRLVPMFVNISDPPRRARDVLAEIAITKHWYSNIAEAEEAGEAWESVFLRRLREDLSHCIEEGKPYFVVINSSAPDQIQGAAFIEPNDSLEVQEAKRKKAQSLMYLEELRNLSPRRFEGLCRGVIAVLGVIDHTVTKSSADEGIDFFGKLLLEQFLGADPVFPGIERQLEVWMIGQAKHYQASNVSTPDIRELVGSVELAKAKAFGSRDISKYEKLELRPCDPIFYLFLTTGSLSRTSAVLLKRSGVIAMDGQMIAQFLASRNVGTRLGVFDQSQFQKWLSKYI